MADPDEIELTVFKHIQKTQDFYFEVNRIGVDVKYLSHVIGYYLYRKEALKTHYDDRRRAADHCKKTKKRFEKRDRAALESSVELLFEYSDEALEERVAIQQESRKKQIKAFTKVISRKSFADETGRKLQSRKNPPNKPPYQDDLLYALLGIFDKIITKRPLRYIAAIFSMFGLHAEKFCGDCPRLDPIRQICRKLQIFKCPNHERARKRIDRLVHRASLMVPPSVKIHSKTPLL